ncbi:MAG: DnaJ domain-containing protein [Nitrospirae bacterium]|jgi:curved DNA-binding protein CbpA|nr:DnaJ domain-containing protein [Nitrospirota bacterium]
MEDITPDYYDILQVSPTAEKEVIEAAYRKLAQKYHPDINKSPESEEKMKRVNAAYEVLSDPVKRAAHDATRHIAQTSKSRQFKTILPRFMGLVTLIMVVIVVALRLSPRLALLLVVISLVWLLYSLFFRNQKHERRDKGE